MFSCPFSRNLWLGVCKSVEGELAGKSEVDFYWLWVLEISSVIKYVSGSRYWYSEGPQTGAVNVLARKDVETNLWPHEYVG